MFKNIIIDANNILYRAYFKNGAGDFYRTIEFSMEMIFSLIRKFNPREVYIVWDGGKSTARCRVLPEYKANRKRQDDEHRENINKIRNILKDLIEPLPFIQLSQSGLEGDDVIGILSERTNGKNLIVSNDLDMIQLINDVTCLLLPTKNRLLKLDNIDEFLGIPLKYFILFKAMVGDVSDNIKGIKGIGPVKATVLINEKISQGTRIKLKQEQLDIIQRNKLLMTINAMTTTEEVEQIFGKVKYQLQKNIDYKKYSELLRKYALDDLSYSFNQHLMLLNKIEKRFSKDGKEEKNRGTE